MEVVVARWRTQKKLQRFHHLQFKTTEWILQDSKILFAQYIHHHNIYTEIHYLQYEVPHLHDQQMNESAHVKTSTIFHKKGRTGPCQRLDPSVSVELEAADGGLERILSWQRGGWRAGETEGERGAAG